MKHHHTVTAPCITYSTRSNISTLHHVLVDPMIRCWPNLGPKIIWYMNLVYEYDLRIRRLGGRPLFSPRKKCETIVPLLCTLSIKEFLICVSKRSIHPETVQIFSFWTLFLVVHTKFAHSIICQYFFHLQKVHRRSLTHDYWLFTMLHIGSKVGQTEIKCMRRIDSECT